MVLDYTRMKAQAERLNDLSEREYRMLEQRARRVAQRQGLAIERSRRRDYLALDYRHYRIVDAINSTVIAGGSINSFDMTLDEVVTFLLKD